MPKNAMEKYTYSGGWFVNKGNLQWEEWQQNNLAFKFKEVERSNEYITLRDSSRNIWVLLPVNGGSSHYAYSGSDSWTSLYDISKEPSSPPATSDIRFLHLSDLHIVADTVQNYAVRQRFDYIKRHYRQHYLIISGDIIDNEGSVLPGTPLPIGLRDVPANAFAFPPPPAGSLAPHLAKAKQALKNAFDILKDFKGKIFVCPGNHDYGLWGNIYQSEFRSAYEQILGDPLNAAAGAVPLGLQTASKRPLLFSVPGNIAIIGVDTAADPYVAGSGAGLASGSVGGAQLSALRSYFLPGTIIPGLGNMLGWTTFMYFHHHPWLHSDWTMKLVDSDQLMAAIRGNVDLILFGHKHVAKRYQPTQVPNGGIKYGALAAGSSRFESTAYEIVIAGTNAAPFIRKVPIV